MKWMFLVASIISVFSYAQDDLKNAPPNFNFLNSKAVFLDFKKTHYHLIYDVLSRETHAYSTIDFFQAEDGYPIIDLVPKITESKIDNQKVSFKLHSAPNSTSYFLIANKFFKKGFHQLKIQHSFTRLVKYNSGSVSSAFWMSDLTERGFLERYLPTSFEHDQLNLSIKLQILNSTKEHIIMTNGFRKVLDSSTWQLSYPSFYTSSLLYLHIFPRDSKKLKSEYIQSIDGRKIPLTVYAKKRIFFPIDLNATISATKKYFIELEKLYGPWPHDFFIAYIEGSGGMEYAGATMTSMAALRHEMNHSYFARNIIPARGNSGWIDEAIASWADDYYPRVSRARATGVASHSVYRRTTDRNSYGPGSKFLAYLDKKFESKGGLQPFLKHYFEKRKRTTVLTKDFQKDMEDFFNVDLGKTFSTYVYSKTFFSEAHAQFFTREAQKYHPHHTEQELLNSL